ncbi:MAG TPA: NAD(P)/FAD-dependent oxidoreductase [Myxococcales bacterium]|nr:NAD(P)/FAD-dependent oxidoreductase [Myxococcales bacterium]
MAKEVLIAGAGFGGLAAARKLARRPGLRVTVIDQRNHHLFQPLLYQVATAGLNPGDIAVPVRAQFAGADNVAVHLGRVETVDLPGKTLSVASGPVLAWDYLILACGAQHSYFGHPQWEDSAPGLKTLEQATEIRRRILSAFESAENSADPQAQRDLLTFVVVGGGPTGVELAGAIADISRTVLVRDFRNIDPRSARVLLLEAGPRVLPAFAEPLSRHAEDDLRALGVEVRTDAAVTGIDPQGVSLGGERIEARSVFWAAGVQASSLGRSLGVPLDRAGRVQVAPDLSIPGHPDAFVIGDMAHLEEPGRGLVPGLAPAAIQEGRAAARNVLASVQGRPRKPFRYLDKGMMATIGKHRAIAQLGRFRLTGYLAWLAWLFIHILYLIGFKNRFSVFAQWMWSYLFSKRGARLITARDWRLPP